MPTRPPAEEANPADSGGSPTTPRESSQADRETRPGTASLHPRLKGALMDAQASVLRQQTPEDGVWRSLYEGGPVHIAAGLIATQLLETPTPARFQLEKDLVEQLLETQLSTGAWMPYAEGKPSRDATRIAALAVELFRDRQRAFLDTVPGLTHRLERSVVRAAQLLKDGPPEAFSPFLDLLADVFHDACHPGRKQETFAQPFSAEAAEVFLRSGFTRDVRHRISSFARQAVPALAILHERFANRTTWVRLHDFATGLLGLNRSHNALRFLERELLNQQARTGGWLWSVLGTTLNLLALRALGHGARHSAVRRGLDFIHHLRLPGADGRVRQGWCNAELWDSAVAASTLLFCGVSPGSFHAEKLVRAVLDEQCSDGLWAFGVGALEGDNDSSSLLLVLLCRLKSVLPDRNTAAIQTCVRALISAQQADGGWGYSPEPHEAPYSFGARSPFGLETTLIDGSTPDVTGRVWTSLLTARATGLLDEATLRQLQTAGARAEAYLKASQTPTGAWQGRWTAGYLSPLFFILPAVRAAGLPFDAGWLKAPVDFVLRTQNPDGGWGESVLADHDASLAGRGPSTPVQTAYALAALIAAAPDAAALACHPAVHAGAEYLLRTQVLGTWNNDRPLYTVAFRDDYFDASLMTQTLVLCVLRYLDRALVVGPARASQELAAGEACEDARDPGFARVSGKV